MIKYRRVLALDPGPEESAWVLWNGCRIVGCGIEPNPRVMQILDGVKRYEVAFVCEMITSYGMAVGAETFETCVWIGRFMQVVCPRFMHRIPRLDVKLHVCHRGNAKDANVRQALIDRYGPPGTKKNPGALQGARSHVWSALAVAVTFLDLEQQKGNSHV